MTFFLVMKWLLAIAFGLWFLWVLFACGVYLVADWRIKKEDREHMKELLS